VGENKFIESLTVKHQGYFVDRVLDVLLFDHRFDRDIAKVGYLLAGFMVNGVFASANQDLGLDSDFPKFRYALLGGFGL
jgi:hypothetical protein